LVCLGLDEAFPTGGPYPRPLGEGDFQLPVTSAPSAVATFSLGVLSGSMRWITDTDAGPDGTTLTTERLILREQRPADTEPLVAAFADENYSRFKPLPWWSGKIDQAISKSGPPSYARSPSPSKFGEERIPLIRSQRPSPIS